MFVMSLWILLLVSVLLCTSSSSSPTSELTSKISGVEDLLEDFRHELQRDGEDPGRMQEDAGRDVCVSSFTRTQESIIRASASIDQGAEYLTSPAHVISRTHCVHACCSHPHCTDVIIHEDLQRDSLTCYLFNCTHRGRNVCLFSPQPGFSTYSRGNSTGPGRTPAHRGSDEPPRSDAGQDLVVQLPTDWAVLDARDSTDDGDDVLQYQWTLVEGNPSVHMKVTHPGLLKLSGLREGMYTFQITVTDTAGQKSSDNVSVSVLAPASNAEVCTGHCSRYQFMCDDGCCIDIGYACDGKQHCPDRSDEDFCQNFDSRQKSSPPFMPVVDLETERAAQQPSTKIQSTEISYKPEQHYAMINQDPCSLSPVVGPCKGAFPRWYYDAVTGQCLHFLYGGCKGNHNNFLQKSECVNECIQKTLPKQQVTSAPSTIITTHTATVASVYKEKYQSPFLMRQNSLPVPEEHHIIQGHPPPESGAILPLAMGLIISILLLLMAIGRLWLVRRRLKKALPLTTEESDYLINGMYL